MFVIDNERHCFFNLDVEAGSMAPVIGVYDYAGEEDGPIEIASLSYPSSIAVRGSVIYIAEHPREYQGAVRVMYSLEVEGLVSFQTVWRGIAYSMEPNSSAVSLFLLKPLSQTVQLLFTKSITKRPSETAKLHQENGSHYSCRP